MVTIIGLTCLISSSMEIDSMSEFKSSRVLNLMPFFYICCYPSTMPVSIFPNNTLKTVHM